MYNLGSQFKFNLELSKSNPEATIVGEKYRFTVLTDSLIRLEYSESGKFIDNPSTLVWFRNLPRPDFYVRGDKNSLELKTKNFTLTYLKNAKFSNLINQGSNLKIFMPSTNKIWYFKHPEAKIYPSFTGEFDKNNDLNKIRSFYSLDGFVSINDSKSLIFLEDGTIQKREVEYDDIYFFFYGNNFYNFLNDYYKITGYPALVPRYALGVWWYKDEAYNDYTLNNLLKDFSNKEVPLSVLILNNNWHKNKTGFTFNSNYFKDPNKMISYLHNNNIHLGLTLNASDKIYRDELEFNTASKYINVEKNGTIKLDFKNNIFLDIYFKIFVHSITNMDVDFFNLEGFNDDLVKFYLNHYHSLDTKAIENKRNLILTSDANIGTHRYPVSFTGHSNVSFDTLKKLCEYNLNMAGRGINYVAHAYGGFKGGIEDSELYIRFVQLATFSPIFLLSSNTGKYYKREPWKWDNHTFSIASEFMKFRHKLVPYLYTEAFKASALAHPLVEPVYYRYPALYDDVIYHLEYFFGSELYISPILNKKEEILNRVIHRFYLPGGVWYDFYTGKRFIGSKKYVLFYNDESYPVFAKSGAIIPFGYNEKINDINNPTNLEIVIFPGANNTYTLYEDDSYSADYKNNISFQTDITYKYFPNNFEIIISPKEGNSFKNHISRNYKLVLKNIKESANIEILIDLKPWPFRKYSKGNDLIIELNNVNTLSNLNVKVFGNDIEVSNYRVLNDDVQSIISDLFIDTELKNQIDEIVFSSFELKKKRIEIRKLKSKGLEPRFINLFLKLLEYIQEV